MLLRRYHHRKHHRKHQTELPPTRGYGVPIDSVFPRSLVEYTIKELKELCKTRGLTGYSKKSEEELIEMLLVDLKGGE